MRALNVASASVRGTVQACLEALVVVAIILALVLGLSPVSGPVGSLAGIGPAAAAGGKLTATITFAATSRVAYAPGEMGFAVTRSVADNREAFWVTNTCYGASGETLSRVDLVIVWGMWNSLEGSAGPFELSGTHCRAIVTLKPWLGKPLGDAVLEYDVLE